MLYAGVGLLQDGKMKPAVPALNIADGSEAWRVVMDSGSGHALDSGFQFVVDEGKAKVWKVALTSVGGELSGETTLSVEELSQGAKIRVDPVNGGYFVTSTAWGVTGAGETNVVLLVRLDTSM